MADRSSGSPAPSADLRPLSTSQLIDRGFTLYRQNFAGLFLLALLSQIAPMATSQFLLTAIRMMPVQGEAMAMPITELSRTGVVAAVWIISQVITFAFGVVMTVYVSDAYLGNIPYLKKSFSAYRRCSFAALATSLMNIALLSITGIFPIIAFAAFYLCLVMYPPQDFFPMLLFLGGGLLLFVGSLAPLLIVFMRLMLTIPAVALERLSGWVAIKRSSVLVRYDPGLGVLYWGEMRLSFLLLPLFVIELLALGFLSLPALIHEINEALMHGSVGQISAPAESAVIVSQVLVLISGSLLLPLYLIATTLFYFDVRIRREGFDLEYLAARVKAAS